MQSYQNFPYSEFLQRNSAEYVHSIQILTSQFSNVLNILLRVSSEFIISFFVLILLFKTDAVALGVLVIILMLFTFIYSAVYKKKVQEYGRLSNISLTDMVKGVNEGIQGMKEVRILGKESFFHDKVHLNAKRYADASLKFSIASIIPRYFLEFIMIVFIVLLVMIYMKSDNDIKLLLPVLGMFGVASVRMIPAVSQILSGLNSVQNSKYGLEILAVDLRKGKIFAKEVEVHFSPSKSHFNSLELRYLSYTYVNSKSRALTNISLKINANEIIGIIGSSGSGKTTLIDVILGLLKPDSGDILFNGENIEDNMIEWRSNVAYLPQNVFLIDDSLKANIALGVSNAKIDEDRVYRAIDQANLADFVDGSTNGIETQIGEGGMRVSGGQKQRIALARAFYFNRSVLIMDESTSALDSETEKEVVNEIKMLKGKVTIIIIAHRLTTLQHCNVIYKIEGGEIVEYGDYNRIVG
jgi:ABC-type multidrug transport system fused ATPase/permease subunit